jgi:hypothetical protein
MGQMSQVPRHTLLPADTKYLSGQSFDFLENVSEYPELVQQMNSAVFKSRS